MTLEAHGPRFDPDLANVEIVELMRGEISDYQAARVIPPELEIDVWLGTAGSVDSIDIVIQSTGEVRVFLDSYLEGIDEVLPDEEMYTPPFRGLLGHLRMIHSKWQRRMRETPTDFFSNNYRGQVRLDYKAYARICASEGVRK